MAPSSPSLSWSRLSSETLDLFQAGGITLERPVLDRRWMLRLRHALERQRRSEPLVAEFGGELHQSPRSALHPRLRTLTPARTTGVARREFVFYFAALEALRAVEGAGAAREAMLRESLRLARDLSGAVDSPRPHPLDAACAYGIAVGASLGYVRGLPNAAAYFQRQKETHARFFSPEVGEMPSLEEYERWLDRLREMMSPMLRDDPGVPRDVLEAGAWQRLLVKVAENRADERAWEEVLVLCEAASVRAPRRRKPKEVVAEVQQSLLEAMEPTGEEEGEEANPTKRAERRLAEVTLWPDPADPAKREQLALDIEVRLQERQPVQSGSPGPRRA